MSDTAARNKQIVREIFDKIVFRVGDGMLAEYWGVLPIQPRNS